MTSDSGLGGGPDQPLYYKMGLVLIGLAGLAVLLRNWWMSGTLFLDEVLLLESVVERGFGGFAEPLENTQIAPLGFLVVQKLMVEGFGLSERVVRGVPTLAALATVPAGAWLVYRTCRPVAGLVVYTGLLTNQIWLFQAVQVKPYTLDVLFAVLGLLVGLRYVRGPVGRGGVVLASVVGGVGCWFSIPFYLVAMGLGVVVLAVWLREPGGRRWWALVLPVVVGGVSGAVHYVWALRAQRAGSAGSFMEGYWGDALLPMPWAGVGAVRHWLRVLEEALVAATGLAVSGAVLLLVVLAVVVGVRGKDRVVWLMGVPVLVAVLASVAGLYPLADRLVLYLGPCLLVLAGLGLGGLGTRVGGRSGLVLVLVMGGLMLSTPLAMARWVPRNDELKPVLRAVHERLEPGQWVYVFEGGLDVYDFYVGYLDPGLGFDEATLVRGADHEGQASGYAEEIGGLAMRGEGWLVFSHETRVGGIDEAVLFDTLLASRGEVLEVVEFTGARAVRWRGGGG